MVSGKLLPVHAATLWIGCTCGAWDGGDASHCVYGKSSLAGAQRQGTAEAGPVEAAESRAGGGHSGKGTFRIRGPGVPTATGATARTERPSGEGPGSA